MSIAPLLERFVPNEYMKYVKIAILIIFAISFISSIIRTISNNKTAHIWQRRKKSVLVVIINNIFFAHFVYGILFVDLIMSSIVGISYLICLLGCFIHWKLSKCIDFPHFFATKSGWITALVPLVIGSYFVGVFKDDFWERMLVLTIMTGSLLIPTLIYTLVRYKVYYKSKIQTKKSKTKSKTTPKTTTPKNTIIVTPKVTPKTTTTTTTPKTTTTTTTPTTTTTTTTPKTTTTTTPKTTTTTTTPKTIPEQNLSPIPKTAKSKSSENTEANTRVDRNGETNKEYVNSIIDEPIIVNVTDFGKNTLDTNFAPSSKVIYCDLESFINQKRNEINENSENNEEKAEFDSPIITDENATKSNTNESGTLVLDTNDKAKQNEMSSNESFATLILTPKEEKPAELVLDIDDE